MALITERTSTTSSLPTDLFSHGTVKVLSRIPRKVLDSVFLDKNQVPCEFNKPLPRWRHAKWLKKPDTEMKVDNHFPLQTPESKWDSRQKIRLMELERLELPLKERESKDLLEVVRMMKQSFKKTSADFSIPQAYEIQISDRIGRLEIFDAEKKKREFVLTFFDKDNLICKGAVKEIYHAWTLNGLPKHLSYARTPLFENAKIKIAQNEGFYLNRLFTNQGKPCYTVKPYKSVFYEESNEHGHMILMKYYPLTFEHLLRDICHKRQMLSFEKKIFLSLKLADIFKYFKTQGVVHRDVKAENLLLSKNGDPCFCDFGFMTDVKNKENFETCPGSVDYAPYETLEHIVKKHAKPNAETSYDLIVADKENQKAFLFDLWGLGILLYVLFFEKHTPWDSVNYNEMPGFEWILNHMQSFHKTTPKPNTIDYLIWTILQANHLKRPTIEQIIDELKSFQT